MAKSKDLKLGLCCISEMLRHQGKQYRFRTMTRAAAQGKYKDTYQESLREIYRHNLDVTLHILKHCVCEGIKHYRLSSSLFPLIGEETIGLKIDFLEDDEDLHKKFAEIAQFIKTHRLSVGSHPDQYVVLPSKNDDAVRRAIFDLTLHGWLHDKLELPLSPRSPINIHPGISSMPEDEIAKRFFDAFEQLPDSAQKRLAIENEDKGKWNCTALFEHFGERLPLTYDNLHNLCNPAADGLDGVTWALKFKTTWTRANVDPVFHWSENLGPFGRESRKHREYFTHLPDEVMQIPDAYWECEVKGKDAAIEKVREKFNTHTKPQNPKV